MRIVSIVSTAALVVAFAVPASQAEAKGRRAFGGVWTAAHAHVPIRTTIPTGASPPVPMPVEASQSGPIPVLTLGSVPLAQATPVPEAKSVPDAKPVIREAVAAAPWCAKGRVFGSGAGFCEIN